MLDVETVECSDGSSVRDTRPYMHSSFTQINRINRYICVCVCVRASACVYGLVYFDVSPRMLSKAFNKLMCYVFQYRLNALFIRFEQMERTRFEAGQFGFFFLCFFVEGLSRFCFGVVWITKWENDNRFSWLRIYLSKMKNSHTHTNKIKSNTEMCIIF